MFYIRRAEGSGDSRGIAKRTRRSERGNMMVLALAVTVGLLVALGLFVFNYTRMLGGHEQHATAIEASSLAAAQAISRIVVEDPNFGFISLSDYPPIGNGTKAGDGEPLPVLGINTIVGTARLDMIIAHELGDDTMKWLADKDVENTRAAARRLVDVIKSSLQPGGSADAKDLDGNAVTPYDTARGLYDGNRVGNAMGGSNVSGSFKLTLGYLDGGSSTLTSIPQPEEFAEIQADQKENNKYKAFINIPAKGKDFYFAGLGDTSRLVNNARFREDDGIRIPSIVKAEADHAIKEFSGDKTQSRTIHNVACAQPGGMNDNPPGGTIGLSFPSGEAGDISYVRDLLRNPQLKQSRGRLFSPTGGDWPGEGNLAPSTFLPGEPSPSQMWATGLYHWIRSGRTKPNVKDLKEMQDVSFDSLGEPGDMTTVYNRQWMQMALAAGGNQVTETGILSTSVGTATDPRLDEFASGSSQAAQDAYWDMASYSGGPSLLPFNTFVVGVDEQGNIFSADGSQRLSERDIHEFWTRVAETNTSGLITMAMANNIKETAQAQVANTLQQINSMKATIESLQVQLASDPEVAQSPEKQAEIRGQIDQLTAQIPPLEQSLGTHNAALEKADDAYRNGSMAASITHTMISNQRTLTAQGFAKEGATFLLAGTKFEPHPMPPSGPEAIVGDTANSGNLAGTLWTAKQGFYVFEMPAGAKVSRRPDGGGFLPQARAGSVMPKSAKRMYLFEFASNGDIVATSLPQQPFEGIPVSEKQLLGLCYDAITSGEGGAVPVTWTATLRDLTARLGRVQGGKHAGEPMVGSPGTWCEQPAYGSERRKSEGSRGRRGSRGRGFGLGDFLGGLLGQGGNSQGNRGNSEGKGKDKDKDLPPGQQKKLARANYTSCPGMSTEFQLRTPLVGNAGFAPGAPIVLSADRATPMFGEPSNGPATVNTGSINLTIPGTSNYSITNKPGQIGPPSVMAPGGSSSLSTVPAAPADLL